MIPVEHARYSAVLTPAEIGRGGADGWIDVFDVPSLAWLCWRDLGEPQGVLGELAEATERNHILELCRLLAATAKTDTAGVWRYLAADWERTGERSDGRQRYLLDRVMRGEGMNWQSIQALLGTDCPEAVDAAFDRRELMVGHAVIGLALTHPDPDVILPRVARALGHNMIEVRRQGAIALGHVARLHQVVDRNTLAALRSNPNAKAEGDLWLFVPRHKLPLWLWWRRLT